MRGDTCLSMIRQFVRATNCHTQKSYKYLGYLKKMVMNLSQNIVKLYNLFHPTRFMLFNVFPSHVMELSGFDRQQLAVAGQ